MLCVTGMLTFKQAEQGDPYVGIRHGTRDNELPEFTGMTCEN